MRWLFVALTLLGFPASSKANDAPIEGVGGSWRPLQGEHKSVRMVREQIRINVYRHYYVTTAEFEFHNLGAAANVAMGFPESGFTWRLAPKQKGFTRFASWADGRRIRTTRKVLHSDADQYQALWIKRVPFKAGQHRKIRVRYRSRLGGANHIAYSFSGGNWRSDVQSSELKIVLHIPHTVARDLSFSKPGEWSVSLSMRRRGRNLSYSWKNWQAEGSFNGWFSIPEARKR